MEQEKQVNVTFNVDELENLKSALISASFRAYDRGDFDSQFLFPGLWCRLHEAQKSL